MAATNAAPPSPAPVTPPAAPSATDAGDSAAMAADDFLIDGVPYAKVLYLEGNVWIRGPDDTMFHRLAEDEPIAQNSVIYTGFNGILDFATGPGVAVRMVPLTVIRVTGLPQPATLSNPTTRAPETSQVGIKKGTIFSALGRADGQPIDFTVRTPEGVAGARGTMFATTASEGGSQVSMLHGTVNFETPDHQTSQIAAGQSQQISGTVGGKYQLGKSQALNPARSEEFFNHAGGLLEHASGYGVVRRGLGPDVARTLHEHGYALPAATQQRFQNAAKTHYATRRPAFHNTHKAHGGGTGEKTGAGNTPKIHSTTTAKHETPPVTHHPIPTAPKERVNHRFPGPNNPDHKDR